MARRGVAGPKLRSEVQGPRVPRNAPVFLPSLTSLAGETRRARPASSTCPAAAFRGSQILEGFSKS